MGRLLGYMSNRADGLRDALHQERAALTSPPAKESYGWGLGFYQGGEVLHKKRPQATGEQFDPVAIAEGIRTTCALLHLRQPTVGDFRAENTHPFRHKQWLFAHNGTIDRFDAIRGRLLDALPDFLRRNIRGETDSEHIFHAVLSFVHDAGQLENPDAEDRIVLSALRTASSLVDRLAAEVSARPPTLNVLMTNGRKLYAMRRSLPMAFVSRKGLHTTLEGSALSREKDAAALRFVLVASNGPSFPPDYEEIPDGAILVVDRDLVTTVHR